MAGTQVLDRVAFFEWAQAQPAGRYERIEGEVVRMSPERVEHVSLKSQIWLALYQALRETQGYHAYADGMTVAIGTGTDFEPDASINRGPKLREGELVLTDPVVVVEVLSPSSQRIDTTIKRERYFSVPSIEHYLIFRTDRQMVAWWRRGSERPEEQTGGRLRLDPPGIVLDIGEIYRLAEEQ